MNEIIMKSTVYNRTENIVIFLHGYGNCGADYVKSADQFYRDKLPNTVYLFPDAPDACEDWVGYQWFRLSLDNITYQSIREGLDRSADMLYRYIGDKKCEYNCKNVDLIGISQGSFMALEMMYYTYIRKIVVFCGMFIKNTTKSIYSNPDVLLVHSDDDNLIPYQNAIKTKSELEALEINTKMHTCHNIKHSVSKEGWKMGANFISQS